VTVASWTASDLVLSFQGFPTLPAVADIQIDLESAANPPTIPLEPTALTADGLLDVPVPRGATSVLVRVNLGNDVLPCTGFHGCTATSTLTRKLEPPPPPLF